MRGERRHLSLHERRAHEPRAQRRCPDAVLGSLERKRLDEPDGTMLRGNVAGLERRRDDAVHGGDHEDAPLPTRLQVRPGVAGEQERARQEHRHERVPAVLVERVERRDVLEASIRDESVDATELLDGSGDRCPVPVPRREVDGERLSRPLRIRLAVDGQHLPAVIDEALRDRAAMPLAAPVMSAPSRRHGPPRT